MTRAAWIVSMIFLSAATSAAEPVKPAAPLWPDSLWNWLKIIDLEGYELRSAVDRDGFFFAVKEDADGDLLFCRYAHSKEARAIHGFATTVVDDAGKGVGLFNAGKESPKPVEITYSEEHLKPHSIASSVTMLYAAGTVLALKNDAPRDVVIRFEESLPGGKRKLLFEQSVQRRRTTTEATGKEF